MPFAAEQMTEINSWGVRADQLHHHARNRQALHANIPEHLENDWRGGLPEAEPLRS